MKWIKAISFIFIFLLIERFCHWQTEGFHVHKIQSDLSYHEEWTSPSLEKSEEQDIRAILSQSFHFLGSGGQCYAFLSEDHQYVLKFFKHHHMRPESWLNHIPLPNFLSSFRDQIIMTREKRLKTIFGSCKLAYDHFREGTGLVYIHLNKTDQLHLPIHLYDKLNILHVIDADKMEFAIQRNASLAYETIDNLMKTEQIDKAKECLDSLLQLIVQRCKSGIADRDPIIKRNFGFIEQKAVEIDLGSFQIDESLKRVQSYKRELFYETLQLRKWIGKHHTSLSSYLTKRLEYYLENS